MATASNPGPAVPMIEREHAWIASLAVRDEAFRVAQGEILGALEEKYGHETAWEYVTRFARVLRAEAVIADRNGAALEWAAAALVEVSVAVEPEGPRAVSVVPPSSLGRFALDRELVVRERPVTVAGELMAGLSPMSTIGSTQHGWPCVDHCDESRAGKAHEPHRWNAGIAPDGRFVGWCDGQAVAGEAPF